MDKVTKRNHEKVVSSKVYIRELKNKIADHQKRRVPGTPRGSGTPAKGKGKDYRNIGEEDVIAMEAKLDDLKTERVDRERTHYKALKSLEREKESLLHENSRFEEKLKEKDKEIRLNKLKMSELKRLQRHRAVKPMNNSSKPLEMETPMETDPNHPIGDQSHVTTEEAPKKTTERHVDNINENPEDFEFVTKEEGKSPGDGGLDTENDNGGFDLNINEGLGEKRDTLGGDESINEEFGGEFGDNSGR